MPNNWDDLIQGVNQGLSNLAQSYNDLKDRELAGEIYRTALKGIQQTLSDYQTQQQEQSQSDIGELQKMINGDEQQLGIGGLEVAPLQDASQLDIISTPANIQNLPQKFNIQKKPITLADLYQDVTDAQARLMQFGERGKIRAEQLAGYLETALKDDKTKLIKLGNAYFTYQPNDVMGSLKKLYEPEDVKAGKINIVWGQPEYKAEADGTYWREYPIEDVGTGELLDRKHKVQVSAEEYNKYLQSLELRKTGGSPRRSSYGKPKAMNYNYETDAMLQDTKEFDKLLRKIEALGGLNKIEDMADAGDLDAIKLLSNYDQQAGIVSSYGVDPISSVEALRGANNQESFMENVDDREAYIQDIREQVSMMLTPEAWDLYDNAPPASDPHYANQWDQQFWTWVDSLEADGVPNDIIDRYVKRPYDNWRKRVQP